jgi:type II secretory pathway component PulJ
MNQPKGFSLIEVLVYGALLSLIVFVMMHLWSFLQTHHRVLLRAQKDFFETVCALYTLSRDIARAHPSQAYWSEKPYLIMRITSLAQKGADEEQAIGWRLKGHNLYRIHGSYDFQKRAWNRKQSVLMAHNVELFMTRLIHDNLHIKGVRCTCKSLSSSESLSKLSWIRSRMIAL